MSKFSHLDASGNPKIVDVSEKKITRRIATAESRVILGEEILFHLEGDEIKSKKGPVFQTAILAGIMGAKQTPNLIPLCHPLNLSKINIDINVAQDRAVVIRCTVQLDGPTGVEMEALTGASIAALTIYDMCKAFSHDIRIEQTQLISKSGGKRDFKRT